MSLLSKILGDPNKKIIKELESIVVQVNDLEPKFKKINHRISSGETFDNILERYSVKKDEVYDIKKKLSRAREFYMWLGTKYCVELLCRVYFIQYYIMMYE